MKIREAEAPSRRARTRTLAWRALLSLLVSALFVWLSLRKTDAHAVLAAIAAARPLPLVEYVLILLAVHLVRTVRWGLLLEPAGHVGFKRLNNASAIGFMLLMLLPLRLGELARPLLVAQAPDGGVRLRRSATLASCVVERVIDGLAVAALGIVALRFLHVSGAIAEFARHAMTVVGVAFGVLCAALLVSLMTRQRTTAALHALVARVAPHRADRLSSILRAFLDALNLGSPMRIAGVLALTLLLWTLHVVGFAIMAPAFGIELTLLMACAVLAAQAVGVMVPAGPGMVGTSQFFTQAGLSLFLPGALSVPDVAARAAGYANTIWLLQLAQPVGLGLVFWVGSRVSLAEMVRLRVDAAVEEHERTDGTLPLDAGAMIEPG